MSEKPEAERWSMGEPHPNPLGDWVPYENYERLKADNERLRGLLREAREYLPEHHPIAESLFPRIDEALQEVPIDLAKQRGLTADDARELLIITGAIEAAPPTMPCAYPHCCATAGNRCPRMFAGQCSGPREAKPCA